MLGLLDRRRVGVAARLIPPFVKVPVRDVGAPRGVAAARVVRVHHPRVLRFIFKPHRLLVAAPAPLGAVQQLGVEVAVAVRQEPVHLRQAPRAQVRERRVHRLARQVVGRPRPQLGHSPPSPERHDEQRRCFEQLRPLRPRPRRATLAVLRPQIRLELVAGKVEARRGIRREVAVPSVSRRRACTTGSKSFSPNDRASEAVGAPI